MKRILLILFLVLLIISPSYGDYAEVAQKVRGLDVQYGIYLLSEFLPGGYYSAYPAPYPGPYNYPVYDGGTLYHVRCAAQITNRGGETLENLELVCEFIDSMDRVLGRNPQLITLKPGESIRKIFYSGISSVTISGYTLDTYSRVDNFTPQDEISFLNYGKNIPHNPSGAVSVVLNLTVTTVKCRFRIFYENRDFDYKNY